ncbi:SPOR domain-containing protein [Zooshikella sp. RANM57]|uniref:SPOR domain-containing protein n=1 Tax=Zooshikella sp. RANM57 TaxID=3425863 RepID=UPI003D70200A
MKPTFSHYLVSVLIVLLSGCSWFSFNDTEDASEDIAMEESNTQAVSDADVSMSELPSGITSGWECLAGKNTAWKCRPGEQDNGENFNETLESVSTKERPRITKVIHKQIKQASIPRNIFSEVPTNYLTLQLLAAQKTQTINNLLKQHPFLQSGILLEYTAKQKNWHVLVYGLYENQQQAKLALSTPPLNQLRNIKPWPRSIESLNSVLNKH